MGPTQEQAAWTRAQHFYGERPVLNHGDYLEFWKGIKQDGSELAGHMGTYSALLATWVVTQPLAQQRPKP